MKSVKALLACICFFMLNTILSQDVKFGRVSKEELEEKFNPADTSAAATYLYKYRKTYFIYQPENGFILVTKIHHRIKIYKQEGFEYATRKIKLYRQGGNKEEINGLKATTYSFKNGKIEEDKLKKDGEFEVALSENWNEKSFTMPNIDEGSVIEYKYEIRSPFISNVDEFVFQHSIPVKQSLAIMEAPQYFNFRLNSKGFLPMNPKKSRESRQLTFQQKVPDRTVSRGETLGTRTTMETSKLDFLANVTSYEMNNVPALKREPYMNSINNYRSGVTYELAYTDFPSSPKKMYSTNWEAVVKTIYESASFGAELKKTGYFEDDIDAILSSTSDSNQKISAIFSLVKSKVKWNGLYSKYTISGVRKAYKEGTGNVAEINLMLTSMLRYAGLDANPVLVSTRAHGIPLFPTREGYNYVISSVSLPEGVVMMDATEIYGTPNVLPFRTLNWQGRIIRKDGTSATISLYPAKSSLKRIFNSANLSDTGALDGKIQMSYGDHDAISFRKSYFKASEEAYLEELEKSYGEIEIDNFEVKNTNELSKSPGVSYNYALENGSDVVADKIYFAPMSFLRTTKNPFTLEKREFPVDFGYPTTKSTISTVTLPEGYIVESMPESMSLALPDGMGSFKYVIQNNVTSIQVKVTTKINNAVIPPLYYDSLKEYYKKMIEKMNEKVVLSKG